ncbi:MAG: AMP-binding protein [Alphaproteobacteria bacterium]|nr:AMP-binding protein [Alphaproteobacteria bacterium SS10]
MANDAGSDADEWTEAEQDAPAMAPLKLSQAQFDDQDGEVAPLPEAAPVEEEAAEPEPAADPNAPEPTLMGYDPDGEYADLEDMAAWMGASDGNSNQADIDAIMGDSGVTPEAASQMDEEIAALEAGQKYTSHWDNFCADNLPPEDQLPEFKFPKIWLRHPDRLNAVTDLLDRMVFAGHADSPCFHTSKGVWSYTDVYRDSNQLAHVLMDELGVIPGARVLIRGFNTPIMMAAFLAVLKVGAVAVPTPPSMRARDLARIVDKAQINFAICDDRLTAELAKVQEKRPDLYEVLVFAGNGQRPDGAAGFEGPETGPNDWRYAEPLMAPKEPQFDNFDTAAEDICLIAFTSGTSGEVKGTMHHHRDLIVTADCMPRSALPSIPEDIFVCNMPLSETFGLCSLLLFPMRIGASSILLQQFEPKVLIQAIGRLKATVCCSSPSSYRAMLEYTGKVDVTSLTTCVSSGEPLSSAVYTQWRNQTGSNIIDAFGSTELLSRVVASPLDEIRPGATGKPIEGYACRVVDEGFRDLPAGMSGRLVVKGPTGCRYLGGERQTEYVQRGWNVTGDLYSVDADGFYWFQGRMDDVIDNGGYEIMAPEIEEMLLEHHSVADCAVVAAPDKALGTVAKAYIVPARGVKPDDELITELRDFVRKREDAFKCPTHWDFVPSLPRTDAGVVQRYKLREYAKRQFQEQEQPAAE